MTAITLAWPLGPLCRIPDCGSPVVAVGLCNAHYRRNLRHGDPLGGATAPGARLRHLISEVVPFRGEECLIWPFSRNMHGYGRVTHEGRNDSAHRVVCAMVHGPQPSRLHEVAHSCGNGHLGCVNPMHLRWATRKENHADKRIHGTLPIGEKHRSAKLGRREVLEIRALREKVPGYELAERFGVSRSTVCNIQKGVTWGWLK